MKVYIDNIVVKSKSSNEHVDHLRKSFKRMWQYQLKINPLMCAFDVKVRNFLGFLIHQRGIEIDQNKTKAIQEAKPSQTKKQLQRFLG